MRKATTTAKKNEAPMTMMELQTVLGSRIKVTLDTDLTPEERQTENEQSRIIMGIGKQMINNGDFILRTEKLLAQTKSLTHSYAMELIDGRGENSLA